MSIKLNLVINSPDKLLNTHTNITVFPVQNKYSFDVKEGEIIDLDWIACDGEVDEIIADDILSYFPYNQLTQILSNWIKKLSLTGSLILVGVDLKEVSRLLTFGKITDEEYYYAVYGNQKEKWETKKSGSHLNEMVSVLERYGLKITCKNFNNYNFIIEAKRGT